MIGRWFGNLSFKQPVSSQTVITTFCTLTVTIIVFLRGICQPSSHVKQIISSGEYYFYITTMGFNNSIAPCRNVSSPLRVPWQRWQRWVSPAGGSLRVEGEHHQLLLKPVSPRSPWGQREECPQRWLRCSRSCTTAGLTECCRVQAFLWSKPCAKLCLLPNRNCMSSD